MKLCIIGKPAFKCYDIFHLLLKLLLTEMLCILQSFTELFTNLHRCECTFQIIGRLTIEIIQHFISQCRRVRLILRHNAEALTGHTVLMAVHP